MAILYVRSTDGSDSDNGSTWALAKATLAGAFTAASAGDTIYVSGSHAETQASAMTLTSPGTAASPCYVICADDAAEPPTAVATTATISTTGANSITIAGFAFCRGIIFQAGSGASVANILMQTGSRYWDFTSCGLKLNNSANTAIIRIGTATTGQTLVRFKDCTFTFGHASQGIRVDGAHVVIEGGSLSGTVPTTLFLSSSTEPFFCQVTIAGMDLSSLGSSAVCACVIQAYLRNCKLGSSFVLNSATFAHQQDPPTIAVNCDSGGTNYKYYKKYYAGEITQESTIVLSGGASDGTTATSSKMVSSANAKFIYPLVSDPIIIWNETTGSSVTATIEVVTDNVTLTDAEAWIEVEYLGTSGFPLSLFAHDRAANILSTPANQTSSSVTWTTTGLTTPVKQKLSVSFTPQEKGPIQIRVHLAKASTTMYVDFDPDDVLA